MGDNILYYYATSKPKWNKNPVFADDMGQIPTRFDLSRVRDEKLTEEFTKMFGYPKDHPLSCAHIPKSKYSRLNILLPRKFWDLFMGIYRRIYPGVFQKSLEGISPKVGFSKSAVGPHITLCDPFVIVGRGGVTDEVHQKLKAELANFPKFKLKVSQFEYFAHRECYCLYLQPEPRSILSDLMLRFLKVFPQCHEQISRYHSTAAEWKATNFTPHVSVAKLEKNVKKVEYFTKRFNELKKELLSLEDLEFEVSSVQVLSREALSNDEVFEVSQEIEIGSALAPGLGIKPYKPKWGWNSLTEKMKLTARGRSLIIYNLPVTQSSENINIRDYKNELGSVNLFQELMKNGFNPVSAAILRKYEKTRRVGIAEFISHEECIRALEVLRSKKKEMFGRVDYVVSPLWVLAYPDDMSSWTIQRDFSPLAIANELIKYNETKMEGPSALFELDLILQFAVSRT